MWPVRIRSAGLSVALMGACLSPSGYSFLVDDNARPIVDRSLVDNVRELARDAETRWTSELQPLVHADRDPELARRDLLHHEVAIVDEECTQLRPILSFVHLSDVQLKEHSVSLAGVLGENLYDLVADGAVRHPDLEQYDYAVLLATVLSINHLSDSTNQPNYGACPAPMKPAFAMHTGDAIDASMFSELFEFVTIMGQLDIPFYNVIGNHDVLFFGTFPTDAMKGLNVVLPFVPVHNVQRFMRGHSFEAGLDDISIPHVPRDEHLPTTRARSGSTIRLPRSHYHGFDLACEPRTGQLCNEALGYYAIDMQAQRSTPDSAQLNIRFVMLNTSEITPRTKDEALSAKSRGNMSDEQFSWLMDQLRDDATGPDLIFVAGHHPFDRFLSNQGTRLRQVLAGQHRVVAYITGHTHVNTITRHDRDHDMVPLWEIVGGSIPAYPQFAQIVELLENTNDRHEFFLRVRTFRQQLSDGACPDTPATSDLACLAKLGREGARVDEASAWRTDAQAIQAANGMLRVRVPS